MTIECEQLLVSDSASRTHLACFVGVLDQPGKSVGQFKGISRRYQQTALFVLYDVDKSAPSRRDHRESEGHRLNRDEAEGLRLKICWNAKDVRGGVGIGFCFAHKDSAQDNLICQPALVDPLAQLAGESFAIWFSHQLQVCLNASAGKHPERLDENEHALGLTQQSHEQQPSNTVLPHGTTPGGKVLDAIGNDQGCACVQLGWVVGRVLAAHYAQVDRRS